MAGCGVSGVNLPTTVSVDVYTELSTLTASIFNPITYFDCLYAIIGMIYTV